MPVEVAPLDELGERELRQPRHRDDVGEDVNRRRLDEPRRQHRPTEAERRREQRAERADVGDVLRRERLQRPGGRSVVAEVTVVVVLDDESAARNSPVEKRTPSSGGERDAERELMIRADDHRRDVVGEPLDAEAVRVDGHRHELEAGGAKDAGPPAVARILDRDPRRSRLAQHRGDREERVRRAGKDAGAIGGCEDAARAREERREPAAKRNRAIRLAVGEIRVRGLLQRRARRSQPLRAWEEREVRQVGAQVVASRRDGDVDLDGALLGRRMRDRGDRGRGTATQRQIALRRELRVRADDDAPGDAEVGGERAGRGQLPPDREAPAADERAQLPFDLEAERLPPVEVEREKWSCRHQ